ncbi:nucleoporin NUP188-like [Haliotis rufescens]|uniref:nucleoporin NUP188-like n=1 Tax=Haliotis rufescens TaxID=6454 RepID=UPI00201F35A4|nr:nucleoporin NUP188-like [Haliotis rufescens]
MAGGVESFNNRALWQFISGAGVQRPKELIAIELKKNKTKVLEGLTFYRKQTSPTGEQLKKERKVSEARLEFTQKLSRFLGLDEVQSYDLLISFLANDFRGSKKNLQQVFGHERHAQALIMKIRDYYFTERLYLLKCLHQVLNFWPDTQHPYKEAYSQFLNDLLDNYQLTEKLLSQFSDVCKAQMPTWETHGPLMTDHQSQAWVHQNLKEQCELLELLLLYFKDFETNEKGFVDLLEKFKGHGFGYLQSYKHALGKADEKIVKRIGYLEMLILLDLMDFTTAAKCREDNNFDEHLLLSKKDTFNKVNKIFEHLGCERQVAPLLLGWAVLRQLYVDEDEGAMATRKLGNMALQLGVFDYTLDLLKVEPFNGSMIIASFARLIVYSLMFVTLSLFDEETLGNPEALYEVAALVLKADFNAEYMWQKGLEEGLGCLYSSAIACFPLDFPKLMKLNTSLSSAGPDSAKRVKMSMQELKLYTEYFDTNSSQDIIPTQQSSLFKLARPKLPYIAGDLVIPRGTLGQLSGINAQAAKRSSPVIQWELVYNGWQLMMCEVQELLHQIAQGGGMVSPLQISRVTQVMQLVRQVMTSDPDSVEEFSEIVSLGFQVIQRFSAVSPPPLDLLAHTLECITCSVKHNAKQIWHNMKLTGLLPFLTENVDNLGEVLSGRGLSSGLYGTILASTEATQGRYPLTLAVLGFLTELIEPLSKAEREEELQPVMMYVLREIFPVYHKWRYYDITRRETIGHKCLQVFHKILNLMTLHKKKSKSKRPRLQEVCVYSLLFTEAGRALLDILATGVDSVEQAVASQGSNAEGVGIDLIQLIQLSFSVLNRLLLLRSPDLPVSPTEHALSSQPAGHQHQHIVATIAQYIYHRHDPRLPTLAAVLLKRLALVSPMSILACLGNDAEPIRDMFLTRLQALSEDLRLKVMILELLSECVETQPGLIEVFLNVQMVDSSDGKRHDLSLGKSSCLQTVLGLMDIKKQSSYQCPPDLLCASADFIHSLWRGLRETAMEVLRTKDAFWPSVFAPLTRNLPDPASDLNDQHSLKFEMKTVAFVFKILAQELYIIHSSKLDDKLKKSLQMISKDKRLNTWTEFLRRCLVAEGENAEVGSDEELKENATLQLLLAWKNFLVTSSKFKVDDLTLPEKMKEKIITDLLCGIQAQFKGSLTALNMKLASVASALLFTLVKHWTSCISKPSAMMVTLREAVGETCANSETLIPSVQIGLLGCLTILLQHSRQENTVALDTDKLTDLLPNVCSVLIQSSRQLPGPRGMRDPGSTQPPTGETRDVGSMQLTQGEARDTGSKEGETVDAKLKLQIVTCSLLEELIEVIGDDQVWMPILQQHSILQTLLISVESFMKAKRGLPYVHAVFLLLLSVARSERGSAALSLADLTPHTCLVVTNCYTNEDIYSRPAVPLKSGSFFVPMVQSWHNVYCLCMEVYSTVLAALRHSFLEDALSFAGAHQDRITQSMEIARISLLDTALREAESSCDFICQLSAFSREWRLHLPDVLDKFLTSMVYMNQTFIALLIRPRYLLYVLEQQRGQDRVSKKDSFHSSPMLQHQASTEDLEQPTTQLVCVQLRMLSILSRSLTALKHFTPDLCEVLLDQSMDISEFDCFLGLGFSTPSVDQETQPTFGTFISCVTTCYRILSKLDPRGTGSPHRSPEAATSQHIPKSLVLYVMENSLYIIMSQACHYLRTPGLSSREKQFLKRELGAELNSFLSSMLRYMRRGGGGPTSPGTLQASPQSGSSSTSQLSRSVSQTAFTNTQDQAFFKLVHDFVSKVLR